MSKERLRYDLRNQVWRDLIRTCRHHNCVLVCEADWYFEHVRKGSVMTAIVWKRKSVTLCEMLIWMAVAALLLLLSEFSFGSTFALPSSTAPMSGDEIWRPIPDPTNPGRFVPSYYPSSGTRPVLAIPCTGTGTRSVTFVATGLTQGYYKVEAFYPKHVGNAKNITVQYQTTTDPGFKTMSRKLNQQVGFRIGYLSDPSIVPNSFQSAFSNLTPYAVSYAKSYIWVPTEQMPRGEYRTTLKIRLTDAGCGTPSAPGGRMVASCLRITLMSTIK
jgi:hypothetical protein